jgi:hypothetical protein
MWTTLATLLFGSLIDWKEIKDRTGFYIPGWHYLMTRDMVSSKV